MKSPHHETLQAAGYSDWLAADEATLDYIATRIAPQFGVVLDWNQKFPRLPVKRSALNLGSLEFKETDKSEIKTRSPARGCTALPRQW